MLKFAQIKIGENFCIPSGINHEMEWFRKLPFNKAISLEDNRLEHLSNDTSVWLHETIDND